MQTLIRCFTALVLAIVAVMGTMSAPVRGESFTPLIPSVPSAPRWFPGTDGNVHIVYELLLMNAMAVPVTLDKVEVADPGSGATLATLEGDALADATSLLSVPNQPVTQLPPSTVGVVWFDVSLPPGTDLPAAIIHRVTASVPPGLPVPETVTYASEPAEVDGRAPVVIGPPVLGSGWWALGSCCNGPHRRSFQALDGGIWLSQRFAIDFNKLDDSGMLMTGDPSLNESYPCFGQTLIAVADATVIAAVDVHPDQEPNNPTGITLENAEGNHVILDLGDGRYAFYAHMQAGSVLVKAGDTVKRGQELGKLGNSGASSGPHLHFHIMDSLSPLVADALPYVFDSFTLAGRTPTLNELIPLAEAGEAVPLYRTGTGPRTEAFPLDLDVIDFPVQ